MDFSLCQISRMRNLTPLNMGARTLTTVARVIKVISILKICSFRNSIEVKIQDLLVPDPRDLRATRIQSLIFS